MNASSSFLYEMLGEVIAAEALLILFFVLLVVGHGIWHQRDQARTKRLLTSGHKKLATLLEEETPCTGCEQFAYLPLALQFRLLNEILPSLGGAQRQRLCRLATDLGLLQRALNQCRSQWWWRRLRGARFCTSLGYGHSLILTLLSDIHPIVRSQAAEWASQYPSAILIEHLLELLHDEATLCNYAAEDALLRMGDAVQEPLVSYLSCHSDPKSLEPALIVALGLAAPEFLPAALDLASHQSVMVRLRAVTLLGALGGRDVVDALLERLDDPAPKVRAEAARALGVLGHWPAAGRLAAALQDSAFAVRREAALSLRGFGGPGVLFLRRALSEKDGFASDMARRALDVPEMTALLPSSP